jgi:hypothetical protein
MENHGENEIVTEMTSVVFKAKINELKNDFNNLLELSSKIGSLEKGDRQKISDGTSVGRREFKQFKSLCFKKLESLNKDFTQSKKQPKTKRVGGSNGFRNPIVVTPELPGYFNETNLGPAYEKIKNDDGTFSFKKLDKNLIDYLPLFLKSCVTSSALLTPLFSISAKNYHMQLPDNKQYLKATNIMNKHFVKIFDTLQKKDEEKIKEIRDEHKKLKDDGVSEDKLNECQARLTKAEEDKFNPERFKYARLQSLVSQCRVKKEEYTEPQQKIVNSADIKEKLLNEQKIVSDTLAYYRQEKKDEKKTDPIVTVKEEPVAVVKPTVVAPVVTKPVATPTSTTAPRNLRLPAKK